MTFNKETGNFDVSTEDMYRLRQQAKLTGANLEDLVNTGREAAKLDFIKEKFDLSGLPEEQQNLVSQLATIGKDGSLTVDIPGYGEIKAANQEQLKTALSSAEAQKALADYQSNQDKSDRDLAIAQLTVSERQAATQNEIKAAVINSMSDAQRKQFANDIAESNKNVQDKTTGAANTVGGELAPFYAGAETAQKTATQNIELGMSPDTKDAIKRQLEKIGDVFSGKTFDLMVPSGGAPKVMTENAIYEGIVGDEVFMGTNLSDIFNGVQNLSKSGGGDIMGGKLDININVGGAVNGDGGNISKIFENPKVQKQIMDTVLYKLDSYKKQQGVIA
jgi:hypothetical protein